MSPGPTFADLYRPMSDLELQSLAADWHSLTEEARAALSTEFDTRHLDLIEPPSPDDHEPEFRNLVTLRQYRDLSEAIIARGAIQSAGIFCFLKDENTVRLDWQISNMIGGIRLQVAAADVEAAEAVLASPIPNTIDFASEFQDEPGFQQPRCPQCNSTDISYERSSRGAALTSLYLVGIPLPLGSASWTCNKCSLRWEEADDTTNNSSS